MNNILNALIFTEISAIQNRIVDEYMTKIIIPIRFVQLISIAMSRIRAKNSVIINCHKFQHKFNESCAGKNPNECHT